MPRGGLVLLITQQRRAKLLGQFIKWAVDEGLDILAIVQMRQDIWKLRRDPQCLDQLETCWSLGLRLCLDAT